MRSKTFNQYLLSFIQDPSDWHDLLSIQYMLSRKRNLEDVFKVCRYKSVGWVSVLTLTGLHSHCAFVPLPEAFTSLRCNFCVEQKKLDCTMQYDADCFYIVENFGCDDMRPSHVPNRLINYATCGFSTNCAACIRRFVQKQHYQENL